MKINERLAGHTSFKVGGPVQFWIEPKGLSDLQNLVNLACKKEMPLRIIGAGSNILVDDRGIKGAVVKLNSPYFNRISVCPYSNHLTQKGRRIGVGLNQQVISAGAGVSLARLLRYAQNAGLSGCELLAGIPGTVGGALIMNAGNIGDNVLDITVMDRQGGVKILKRKDIQFGYRESELGRYIILNAHLKLIKKDRRAVSKIINEYLDYRQRTQDLSRPSAGCIFKNPDSNSAAYFIERCGLKGSSFQDAVVSSKHANFILNKGKASSADILRLIRHITRCVKKGFNLYLEPEIRIWRK